MPSLNFTKFVDEVECGLKTQTIRRTRKRPIKAGDRLHLFAGARTKHCRRLSPPGGATCYYVADIEIYRHPYYFGVGVKLDGVACSINEGRAIIVDDGFESESSFFDFFVPNIGDVFHGYLIRWDWWGDPIDARDPKIWKPVTEATR